MKRSLALLVIGTLAAAAVAQDDGEAKDGVISTFDEGEWGDADAPSIQPYAVSVDDTPDVAEEAPLSVDEFMAGGNTDTSAETSILTAGPTADVSGEVEPTQLLAEALQEAVPIPAEVQVEDTSAGGPPPGVAVQPIRPTVEAGSPPPDVAVQPIRPTVEAGSPPPDVAVQPIRPTAEAGSPPPGVAVEDMNAGGSPPDVAVLPGEPETEAAAPPPDVAVQPIRPPPTDGGSAGQPFVNKYGIIGSGYGSGPVPAMGSIVSSTGVRAHAKQ